MITQPALTPEREANKPWLVVIDPQVIFADPQSDWCASGFEATVPVVESLLPHFKGRTVVTRWLPPATHKGSWREYFQTWKFADRPADDSYFDLVPVAHSWSTRDTVDVTTFGKWPALEAITGSHPNLVLAGVATDCCVITTALAAADSGAYVTVISDACAGSTTENHDKALSLMELFAPQIRVVSSGEYLSEVG